MPLFLWTRLFRDALLVPHSPPYRAVTELLDTDGPTVDVDRVAEEHGVDSGMLRRALGGVAAAVA